MLKRGARAVLVVFLLSFAGCAALTRLRAHPRGLIAGEEASVLDDGHEDYVGVIHVHTTASHDAHGRFEDVVRVANAQRLDFVLITEHNTLKPLRDGKQGWHGAALILIGTELSTRGGHYLAFNVTEEIDRNRLTTQQVIDEVNRQGGLGFIAHPYFKARRWTDWSVTGFTGMEAYNVAHDTLDENRLRLILWTLTAPAEPFYFSIIDRPYDPLATWDELIRRHGRVVGIGSTDAHEFHVLGLKFAPYEVMFQLARTHLLIPSSPSTRAPALAGGASLGMSPTTGRGRGLHELTPERLYDALRKGHAYFAIELLTEAKGFSFFADNGAAVLGLMGDRVALVPGLRLSVSLPASASLTVFKDGRPIATSEAGEIWQFPVTEPGVYRVEAARQGKPWIFSNPIYITPPDELPAPAEASLPPSLDAGSPPPELPPEIASTDVPPAGP